jgi:DNA-binding LytR/AlgR family response regulator
MTDSFLNSHLRILILEDEPLVADGLYKHLVELLPNADLLAILPSVKKAQEWFERGKEVDVIFSDIQLADGISFDLFKRFEPSCPVIFTTAFDQYAIRAFEVNSVDFLLKPIEKKALQNALEKLRKRRESYVLPELRMALDRVKSGKVYLERLLVTSHNSLMPITIAEVSGFVKEELIFVLTRDGKRYVTDFQTMEEVESKLDPSLFFRANRQTIIRIDEVKQIKTTYKGLEVHLRNPSIKVLEISRERSPQFKRWMVGND